MKKATLFDYVRMCKKHGHCKGCPLSFENNKIGMGCKELMLNHPDKANEIILKWCDEHPVETRQDKFLKHYPNARINVNGVLDCCPKSVSKDFACTPKGVGHCIECCKDYWLAEAVE